MQPVRELIVWIAQGFGIGRIPFAPGTWGSLMGIVLFLLLIATRIPWLLVVVSTIGALAAVWVCAKAEDILHQKDPSSVVLDEIVAVPVCFLSYCFSFEVFPALAHFTAGAGVIQLIIGFSLFRLFDIWKPWPIRQSQRLPSGWGVVKDDVLAAVYVNIVMFGITRVVSGFFGR